MAAPSWSWWRSFIVAFFPWDGTAENWDNLGAEEVVFQAQTCMPFLLNIEECREPLVKYEFMDHTREPAPTKDLENLLIWLVWLKFAEGIWTDSEAVKTGSGTAKFGISSLTHFSIWTLQDGWRGRDYDRGLNRLQQACSYASVSLMVRVNLRWLKGHNRDHFHHLDHWGHFIYLRITWVSG